MNDRHDSWSAKSPCLGGHPRPGLAWMIAVGVSGCGGTGSTAPPATIPVLTSVLRPGTPPVTVTADSTGSFPVLPSVSAIIQFTAPYPTGLEVGINGTVLEQTNDLPRQQALDAQGLGYWFQMPGSPDVTATGAPQWSIDVVPPIPLRISTGFAVSLTDTSSNPSSTRSAPLSLTISIENADWLVFNNNAGHDAVVVLLDGRRPGGCVDDEPLLGIAPINVGNLLSQGNCNEEFFAFSTGDAVMLWDATITGVWTDALKDIVQVPMHPLWNVPVDVWLLGPGLNGRVGADVARANALYDTSRCGLSFTANIMDKSADQTAIALVGTDEPSMQNANWRNALKASSYFTPGRINVYYLGSPLTGTTAAGFTAAPELNIIVVDTTASNETLAHELGHSFTLQHSAGVPGIPATNIMYTGGMVRRTEFTEGQCYRMNGNPGSTLNTNLVRRGFLRDCPDNATNRLCPPLNFDVPN